MAAITNNAGLQAPAHADLGSRRVWRQQRQRAQTNMRRAAAGSSASPSSASTTPTVAPQRTAREAALAYYDNYNNKNMAAVLDLIAEDCVYEDLIYADAFVGRAAIAAYYDKIAKLVPQDIRFCVEDITDGDPRRCGVRWHVEITDDQGRSVEFPFSRGVSFYEVNEQGQIVFARDLVEPALKPGAAALQGISVVAPLVRKLGPNANPAVLKTVPLASGAMYAGWIGYIVYVMFSTAAPGLPVWQTPPETLQAVFYESLNYFYINIGLAQLGLNPVPCVGEHPVSEALFNFVNAWSLMLWPVMLADPRGRKVRTKFPLWVATQFLTNVFFPIYLAQRLAPDSAETKEREAAAPPARLPGYAPAFGTVAAVVGVVSIGWALLARPEYGDISARWDYFSTLVATSRVDWAFVVDAALYTVWQAWLLGAAGAAPVYRFVPFFGLAGWLLGGQQGREQAKAQQQ